MFFPGQKKDSIGCALVFVVFSLPFVLVKSSVVLAQTPITYEEVDDPSIIHLYLADSGLSVEPIQAPLPGRIIEFSVTEPVSFALLAAPVQATLVRTTLTSKWSRPSPDPMGIGYLASSNRLLISDSEVEEVPAPYWRRVNLFEISLSGSVVKMYTTINSTFSNFSDEPTGVVENPANGHYFFTDDKVDNVFEVNLGGDGLYGTSDDTVSSFSTAAFGSFDAEGLAFDSWQGHLYVVDGVNVEVYLITPGANSRFDSLPPAGDDLVTNFDVAKLGLVDPEGITFNPDNGHLYILSGKAMRVVETTRTGALIRTIDVSFLKSKTLSDLAYAPASDNSGEMRLYIVDRGVDNSIDPNENDGKMYEIAFPALLTLPNSAVISSPPTGLIHDDHTFTANVSPMTTTLPLTYTWQATEQAPVTHTNDLSDTVLFTWDTPGIKAITVTVSNGGRTPAKASSETLIVAPANEPQQTYLPILMKRE